MHLPSGRTSTYKMPHLLYIFSLQNTSSRLGSLHSRHLVVQRQNVRQRTDGRYGEGVDLLVRLGVVVLDVQKVARVLEGRHVPVEVAHPLVQVRVAGANVADVALEVLHVDGVEPDEGDEAVFGNAPYC